MTTCEIRKKSASELDKKVGLCVIYYSYTFFLLQTCLAHLFVPSEISFLNLLILFLLMPLTLRYVKHAKKGLSKRYAVIPSILGALSFLSLYTHMSLN
jgi:hypothetical protein